ncbi:hypothetical protein HYH03_017441 [Edaphochlamys debaryana]|uniref:Uncharacterized protein n=1 Tax=Edaphochlamys debaryana TaxID=47281 RepID=A0A835XGM5_9CHLO|nr:hypothetical protein HYH03_017441 [Edaphochlamys debaryana]|eukprot:KAG2483723.1 hypothetical protein HYH03_017441 [Edaphochlamys debaryana]
MTAATVDEPSGEAAWAREAAGAPDAEGPPDCTVRELDLGVGPPLLVRESTLLQDEAGAVIWDAALVLSHCLAHAHATGRCPVAGRVVVDLGSGTGAAGLAAAALGCARHVVLTDLPHLVPYMRENIAANRLGAACSAAALDWNSGPQLSALQASLPLPLPLPRHSPGAAPSTASSSAVAATAHGTPPPGHPGPPAPRPLLLLSSDCVYTRPARTALFGALRALLTGAGLGAKTGEAVGAELGAAAAGQAAAAAWEGKVGESKTGLAGKVEAAGQVGQAGEAQGGGDGVSSAAGGCGAAEGAEGEQHACCRCLHAAGGGRDSGVSGGGPWGSDTGPLALLSYEDRPGVEELPALLAEHGMEAEELTPAQLHPDWCSPDIHVLCVRMSGTRRAGP